MRRDAELRWRGDSWGALPLLTGDHFLLLLPFGDGTLLAIASTFPPCCFGVFDAVQLATQIVAMNIALKACAERSATAALGDQADAVLA